MLSMLVGWNAAGDIVSTQEFMTIKDENDEILGLVDYEAHEAAGGRMRDITEFPNVVGSATWPEWLGGQAHHFMVELEPNPSPARARIKALVHKTSGHRRERAAIEAAISERINEKKAEAKKRGDERRAHLRKRGVAIADEFPDPPPEAADLRDMLGGPNRPLLLDEDGRTKPRVKAKRPALPVISRRSSHA
jgi:hypothetical protein